MPQYAAESLDKGLSIAMLAARADLHSAPDRIPSCIGHSILECSPIFPAYSFGADRSRARDLGDYDVLAYFEQQKLLLSIECKLMNPAYCLKDTRRLRERIFGTRRDDGSLAEGYLQRVER